MRHVLEAELTGAKPVLPYAMTKNQELQILDETIAKLGRDSYCGPWLASVRAEVEQDIRCDIAPCQTTAESRRNAEILLREAKESAESMLLGAKARAEREIAEARQEASRIRDRIRLELHRIENILDGRI